MITWFYVHKSGESLHVCVVGIKSVRELCPNVLAQEKRPPRNGLFAPHIRPPTQHSLYLPHHELFLWLISLVTTLQQWIKQDILFRKAGARY